MANDTHRPPGIGDYMNKYVQFEEEARKHVCAMRRDARRRGLPQPQSSEEAQQAMVDYMRSVARAAAAVREIGMSGVVPRLDLPAVPCASGFLVTGASHQADSYVKTLHDHIDAYAKNLPKQVVKRHFRLYARELHFNKIDLLRIAIKHKWNIEFHFVARAQMDMEQRIAVAAEIADDLIGTLPPLVAVQEELHDHPLQCGLSSRGYLAACV